jgi:hypothetical protein
LGSIFQAKTIDHLSPPRLPRPLANSPAVTRLPNPRDSTEIDNVALTTIAELAYNVWRKKMKFLRKAIAAAKISITASGYIVGTKTML